MNLWRVSVSGGPPTPVTTGPGDDLEPVVSPDGRTLLFANVKRTWALVAHDVMSGRRRTLIEKRTHLVFPVYSPDGRRIAFAGRNTRGDTHLFVMDADGSNLTSVTNGTGELNIMPQWSHDGATLYFYQVRPSLTFRSISPAGGPSREIAPWSHGRQNGAAVDPAGRVAVYAAVDRGLLQHSRLRELDSGRETTLPSQCTSLDSRATVDGSPENLATAKSCSAVCPAAVASRSHRSIPSASNRSPGLRTVRACSMCDTRTPAFSGT